MSISGIGQNYYHNNVATVRNTKNVNSTGKNDRRYDFRGIQGVF